MLKHVIIKNKKKISYYIKKKLNKKWRFWRVFKFYFLRRKKKIYFFRMKWLFNSKKMLWRQLSVVYGKRIKNRAYKKNKSKIIFNKRFIFILRALELRLNVLLVRLHFVTKLLQANITILKNKVTINGTVRHKWYVVAVGDLIMYTNKNIFSQRLKKLKWKHRNWRQFKITLKKKNLKNKKYVNIYFLLRKNFVLNFIEINYFCFSAILLRNPTLGEISYRNKKQFLISTILKKIYFMY